MAQTLQLHLDSNIGWLQRAYHIARVGINAEQKVGYPQIYANDGTNKHFDIRPDNKTESYSFFEIDKQYEIDVNNDEVKYFFSLVVWANLKILDSAKTYDFTSELIKDITDSLKFFATDIIDVEVRPEKVFDKYSGIKQELKQFLMKPYTAFKITFSITDSYTDNCTPSPVNSCDQNVERINNLPEEVRDCVLTQVCENTPCEPATVENSDQSFSEEIAPGDTLVLEDTTFNIYVNGVLEDSSTLPSMVDNTINIILD